MIKKIYVCPLTEVLVINTLLMQKTGEASLIPGPGAPARRSGGKSEAPVF